MPVETKLARFIRSGGHGEMVLRVRHMPAPLLAHGLLERKAGPPDIDASVRAFRDELEETDRQNRAFLIGQFGDVLPDLTFFPAEDEIEHTLAEYRRVLTGLQGLLLQREGAVDDQITADFEEERDLLKAWLLRRFGGQINTDRQKLLGVTHYIWRTRDDAKVRSGHRDRDDLVYAWDHEHEDGSPGEAFGCRCWAEPAIVNGQILGARVPIPQGLGQRIREAQGTGLANAARDAAVATAEATVESAEFIARAAELVFKEQIGSITPEEQAELDDMRRQVQKRLQELSEIDRETIKALLREVDLNYKATVAHRRSVELSHALGLTSEQRLLQAHQEESHLEGTLLIGGLSAGTALAAAVRGLNGAFKGLKPKALLRAIRERRLRLERETAARDAEQARIVSDRFNELARQGHGPQRHEGFVTRQMLEDRVLHGIDPMTGTRVDGSNGRPHIQPRTATRIKSQADIVAAEARIRRSPEYRNARDLALQQSDLGIGRREFEVSFPIEDVLSPEFRLKVEGVKRIGSQKNPMGTVPVDFTGGTIVARFELNADGEPSLITMFPKDAKK